MARLRGWSRAAILAAALAASAACDGSRDSDEALAALTTRVQALEDEKAIRAVLVRYGETLDARDYAQYSQLFAEQGVWTGGFGSFTGPAAIEAMLRENLGDPEPGFINKSSFHQMTTMVVDVDGDSATARSRYIFYTADGAGDAVRPRPALAGRYVDEFVRENGNWKIARRTTHGVIPWRDGNAPVEQAGSE